jgi:hypothetical protein
VVLLLPLFNKDMAPLAQAALNLGGEFTIFNIFSGSTIFEIGIFQPYYHFTDTY